MRHESTLALGISRRRCRSSLGSTLEELPGKSTRIQAVFVAVPLVCTLKAYDERHKIG